MRQPPQFLIFLALCIHCAYNLKMNYEWDSKKAGSNLKKHGIDFADAVGVFEDPLALTVEEQHDGLEERFVTLGIDFLGRVLVVVYTFRQSGIRIISARKAIKREMEQYYEN